MVSILKIFSGIQLLIRIVVVFFLICHICSDMDPINPFCRGVHTTTHFAIFIINWVVNII